MAAGLEGRKRRIVGAIGTQPAPSAAVGDGQFGSLVIAMRAGEAEGRDRAYDEMGVVGGQGGKIEAEFGDLARRVVVNEEIGPGDSAEEGGTVGDGVEGDAALVGIEIEEE